MIILNYVSGCSAGFFNCDFGGVVQTDFVCDGVSDCMDGSDEVQDCDGYSCADNQKRVDDICSFRLWFAVIASI